MSAAQMISNEDQGIQLVTRWFDEVWNQGKRESIREMFPVDSVLHEGSIDVKGPEDFEKFYDGLHEQFSDFSITPEVSFAKGDMVCMRWKAEFKEKGSGHRLQITGMSIVRQKNGKFLEAWQNWDAAGVQAQLAERAATA
jgi:predicted SnoaL-like aldol condensation-catalyzing enzyme